MLILFRTLHILAAFCYIGGLAGYVGMRVASAKAASLETVGTLVKLQHAFERFMLMPGGALLVICGLLTAWLEHWPRFALAGIALLTLAVPFTVVSGPRAKRIDAALAEAGRAGKITDGLRAAMRDMVLFACESMIVAIVFLILLVMLIKPV